jgi:hypothetical protein
MNRLALMGALAGALAGSNPALAETQPQGMCGRPADMVQLLIEMQKPEVVSLWRDGKMFVNRDTTDNSVWAFALPNTTVHPAAICRRTVKVDGKEQIETGELCTTGPKPCASFAGQVSERFAKIDAGTR